MILVKPTIGQISSAPPITRPACGWSFWNSSVCQGKINGPRILDFWSSVIYDQLQQSWITSTPRQMVFHCTMGFDPPPVCFWSRQLVSSGCDIVCRYCWTEVLHKNLVTLSRTSQNPTVSNHQSRYG